MKKIMTAVCIIAFSAVAASAQQKWGTVGDVNRFGEDAPKVNKTVENKKSSFSWALIRANIKAAQAHRDSLNKAKAEAAAKKESVLAVNTETPQKITFAQIIMNSIPKDGHCSTQPFK